MTSQWPCMRCREHFDVPAGTPDPSPRICLDCVVSRRYGPLEAIAGGLKAVSAFFGREVVARFRSL